MVDRKVGLDYHHCKAVMSELAHFHALSLSMKRIDPARFKRDVSDSITEALFVIENEAWYRDYYKTASKNAIAMVKQTLPEGEMMKQCLENLQQFVCDSTFFSKMVYLVKPREPVAVLTHGDCWTNNILFHYSETGQILEVCLVDFQMARYGSPALDLANLLYCCTSLELRQNHMDNLLEHYHTTLIAAMIELERDRCRETVDTTATQPEHLREICLRFFDLCWKHSMSVLISFSGRVDHLIRTLLVVVAPRFHIGVFGLGNNLVRPAWRSEGLWALANHREASWWARLSLSRSIELIRCVCISGPGVFTLELAADGISRIGLREEMHRCGKFGLGLALDMIPISTCDSDQAPDLYVTSRDDVIMSEGEDVLSTPVWTCNELCRQRMTDLVKELVEKGDL
uniref:CHK kinase-like domain-containing protein n=1 Tax=Timema cristinae TaxID=61476 RepID=A0A7R9GXR2_TIMCR|nr:unnamed protein product [Timema cristinae]